MSDKTSRRRDAARNRERLLTAATELFKARGLEATLNDIAHHAGVGVATAYRNFANKEEVVQALFRDRLEAMIERAELALEEEDAWVGLVGYLKHSMQAKRDDRALAELLGSPDLAGELADQARDRLGVLTNALVRRAQSQGALRTDVTGTDTVFMEVGLNAVVDRTRDAAPDLYCRLLAVFLDGLRARGENTVLVPEPLSVEATHNVMRGRQR
ncbi:TetR/AcrR family transcriptional regulator [Rhodococcus sp. NPDC057529]|uniref:TetR/AcrR family transcriptional regulator n=1 Tax=Rhodococcus sp. NPDC057529 TaxID=3346158 RepID=UPI003672F9C6